MSVFNVKNGVLAVGTKLRFCISMEQNCLSIGHIGLRLPNSFPAIKGLFVHTSSSNLRGGWPCWKMKKDVRIRNTIKEHAFERLNLNIMRKNKILPAELQEICDKEIKELPTDSSITRAHKRCMTTSRPRGLVTRYRLSRIVWRHQADYNYLYGYTRALW